MKAILISKSVIKTTPTLTRALRKDLLGIETPLDRAIRLHEQGSESAAPAVLVTERQRRRFRHYVAERTAEEKRRKQPLEPSTHATTLLQTLQQGRSLHGPPAHPLRAGRSR